MSLHNVVQSRSGLSNISVSSEKNPGMLLLCLSTEVVSCPPCKTEYVFFKIQNTVASYWNKFLDTVEVFCTRKSTFHHVIPAEC